VRYHTFHSSKAIVIGRSIRWTCRTRSMSAAQIRTARSAWCDWNTVA